MRKSTANRKHQQNALRTFLFVSILEKVTRYNSIQIPPDLVTKSLNLQEENEVWSEVQQEMSQALKEMRVDTESGFTVKARTARFIWTENLRTYCFESILLSCPWIGSRGLEFGFGETKK